jgi:hypothetical protein
VVDSAQGAKIVTAHQQWWGITKREVPSTAFFIEDFENGIGGYTTFSGNPALWSIVPSPYGANALRVAATTGGGPNSIYRNVTPITFNRLQLKVRVTQFASDDAGAIAVWFDNTRKFAFSPVRELALDTARRPIISVISGSGFVSFGSTAIAVNTWYRLIISWLGAGGATAVLSNADTGVVFHTMAWSGNIPGPTGNSLYLTDDNATGSSPTEWDDIYLYTE